MNISVVVPVFNEWELIDGLLAHLAELNAYEVIVVDGGSTDGTWERLNDAGAPSMDLYRAPAGRAQQMNRGALKATGDVLLFLHADTRLPPGGLAAAADTLNRHPGRGWGRFDVRFDCGGPTLKLVAAAMNLRSACTGMCTGDQAVFVRRDELLTIGGFAPVPLMEDLDLSRRLKRRSRPLRVRTPVTTSSRRWRVNGAWRTIVLMWRLRWLYWWGVPTTILSKHYYPDHDGS